MYEPIYEDSFLTIEHAKDKSLLILNWKQSPKSSDEFKQALLEYLKVVQAVKAKTAIWVLDGFKIDMDESTASWIDSKINGPSQQAGMDRLALVIGKDLYPHLNAMLYFRKFKTKLVPYNFASVENAIEYLYAGKGNSASSDDIGISFTNGGIDTNGDVIITIRSKQREISNLINCMTEIVQFENNYNDIVTGYLSLTKREVEVLRLYAQGIKLSEIADYLCISELTARTHWKNIKRKLNTKSQKEAIMIANQMRR